MEGIEVKHVDPVLAATIEGNGKIPDFNSDIDKIYEYLYAHELGQQITGPTIGIFWTKQGGKYKVAVPVKEAIKVEGDIKIEMLPAIRCTSLLHTDSPKTIEQSFNKLQKYRKQQKMEWLFPVREIYIPSPKEKGKYYIEIQVPLRP